VLTDILFYDAVQVNAHIGSPTEMMNGAPCRVIDEAAPNITDACPVQSPAGCVLVNIGVVDVTVNVR